MINAITPNSRPGWLGITKYQWLVLFAAWLGWGFDVFDGLLFNYVAPDCIPTLLGIPIGSPDAKKLTLLYTGYMTSILLLGWAAGGLIFGQLADRIGRTKTLLVTMVLYSIGTAGCALAPNIWTLGLLRLISSLGIGGEWAAGASMVAEVIPEKRRVEAGALLYTSAPMGLFLATFVNQVIARNWLASQPEISWRWVFAAGMIPAVAALIVRGFLKEPERWQRVAGEIAAKASLRDLFTPDLRRITLSGFIPSVVVLITWWSCNAFSPVLATQLAQTSAASQGLSKLAATHLIEDWKTLSAVCFNWGGLLGTLLTIPLAKRLGRRTMFALYFIGSAASIMATFGLPLEPLMRLRMYFFIGLSVFGVFGSFTYYLPELFPTRLRATGSGFCYNIGRIIASVGPFLVGYFASQGVVALPAILHTLFWIGIVPLVGLLFLPWVIETRDNRLAD